MKPGYVVMPFQGGTFAVVARDGTVVCEERDNEAALMRATDLNVGNDPRLPCNCETGQPCDCF